MGTNCAPLVADLFFMKKTSCCLFLTRIRLIEQFNMTLRHLDDLLNTDNPYIDQMVGQIYPAEFQLNKQICLIPNPPIWTWTCS